jgi:hypothetical protein
MMKYPDSASFVYSLAKRARKYYLGLTTATQDVEDFLKNEYGKAVLTNSSLQILLKQGTAEVDMVGETFYLSEGERELLLAADVGEGLFFAGKNHVAIKVIAAPFEYQLITSNPEELLKRQQAAQAQKMLTQEPPPAPQQPINNPVAAQPQPIRVALTTSTSPNQAPAAPASPQQSQQPTPQGQPAPTETKGTSPYVSPIP